MKQHIRAAVCFTLACLLILGCFPVSAVETNMPGEQTAPPEQITLLMQIGQPVAALNGAPADMDAAPIFAANAAQMVPLRFVADCLGYTLSWDASANAAELTKADSKLRFAVGQWTFTVDDRAITLNSPMALTAGTAYVPLLALREIAGVYVHTFGQQDGGYLVLTNYPLTQADRDGVPDVLFDPANADPVLLACQTEAIRLLGPNRALLTQNAVLLRWGSRFAVVKGEQTQICEKGESSAPYLSADGFLMVPVAFVAESLGAQYELGADGASTVTYGGRTAVFPAQNGYLTLDGEKKEHAYFAGTVQDGVGYCSTHALTTALGLYGYADSVTQGIILSRLDLTMFDAQRQNAWDAIAGLPLKIDEDAKGYIALTFDDGPSGDITTRLLDGLKARGAHATFFLCNYRIGTFPAPMSRYLAEGHELGNHSANHTMLGTCSASKLYSELDTTNEAIKAYTGASPILMRPPGGEYNQTVLAALRARGMSCIMWSLDTLDWKYRNEASVRSRILSTVKDGDIVLLHDMYQSSVDAALSAIDTLQARGYRFVTVTELAARKGYDLTPGSVYTSLR